MMLLKVLFLLLLVFLASRAIANLVRALLNDPRASERIHESGRTGEYPNGVKAPPARGTAKSFQVEVEDAQWVDVGEKRAQS